MARSNQETDDGKNASPCLTQKAPYKGLGAESEEKREPVSDIDTAVVDSLKAIDPDGRLEKRTNTRPPSYVRLVPQAAVSNLSKPPLYSITSSASASSVGGISRPSSLAAFKLIAISNLVGCTTGRSAGLSPLRIRPA